MSYGYKKDIEMSIKAGLKSVDINVDESVKKELSSENFFDEAVIYNKDKVIMDTCSKYLKDTSYMKFMWFFPTKSVLNKQHKEVIKDFKKAFPKHDINFIIINSDYEYKSNIELLDTLTSRPNTIDIIFCIDMLNMGYHVNNIDGVGMMRSTDSSIIYIQQIGRCISTTDVDDRPKIIFDFVDNIKRMAIYNLKTGTSSGGTSSSEKQQGVNDIFEDDLIAIGNIADYTLFLRKVEQEPRNILAKRAYRKFRQFGGGKDRPDVPIKVFADLYGITVEDIYTVMNIKDIYDEVDDSTRVPDEILNKTGLY